MRSPRAAAPGRCRLQPCWDFTDVCQCSAKGILPACVITKSPNTQFYRHPSGLIFVRVRETTSRSPEALPLILIQLYARSCPHVRVYYVGYFWLISHRAQQRLPSAAPTAPIPTLHRPPPAPPLPPLSCRPPPSFARSPSRPHPLAPPPAASPLPSILPLAVGARCRRQQQVVHAPGTFSCAIEQLSRPCTNRAGAHCRTTTGP